MRIGMMADFYKPHISGVTHYISLNKRYLEQAGHQVYVFTFGEYEDDEPHVIRTPGISLVGSGYSLRFNLRYSRQARLLLQTMDVVHVHHPFISGQLALRYCRPLCIPIVFTNHTRYDLYAQMYLPLLPDEISVAFLQTYLPFFCASVNLVVSPSPGMAEVLRRLGVEAPIEVVPNGVELERFRNTQSENRDRLGFSQKDILLIYVGRLGPEKNLDFLLCAFFGVADAVENVHLLLVGGGPEEEHLKKVAGRSSWAHRVHFTGALPYEVLPHYLAMADIFVTASISEVHPLSVIEAMAAGLPVVGLHSVGVGDTVRDGETGLLTEHSEAAFASHLTRLCLDQELRRKMGEAARQAVEQYAIEHTTQRMLKHYERLIYESKPRRKRWDIRLRNLFS